MKNLEPPDTLHLSAAMGWLELGLPSESGDEIARISPENLEHPDVLEARWQICAEGQRWESAAAVAEKLIEVAPKRSAGWIHRAYALRRTPGGGLGAAWQALRPAFDKFPKVAIIPYNLACYAAQFGRLEEAMDWLQKARERAGDVERIKQMALADRDLQPLWAKIREW